jgi:hypothetical protein
MNNLTRDQKRMLEWRCPIRTAADQTSKETTDFIPARHNIKNQNALIKHLNTISHNNPSAWANEMADIGLSFCIPCNRWTDHSTFNQNHQHNEPVSNLSPIPQNATNLYDRIIDYGVYASCYTANNITGLAYIVTAYLDDDRELVLYHHSVSTSVCEEPFRLLAECYLEGASVVIKYLHEKRLVLAEHPIL